MVAAALNAIWRTVSPARLTGPIFEKELRVSSRRRRNYVLRAVYLGLMSIFVVLVWLSATVMYGYSSAAYSISRMAMAGKTINITIAWFQFCMLQLIAIVALSNSISEEIHHKTLGILMTTPINSFQIVMGKLLSKLWQLLILLALSVPLLAIVRVFGGVPWRFVISSTCITLTAVIFTASVSMYFSIHSRRAYAVVIKTLVFGGIVFALLPWLVGLALHEEFSEKDFVTFLIHPNPAAALGYTSALMMSPRIAGAGPFLSVPLHCVVMLSASALFLALIVSKVRKVSLRQATGQAGVFVTRRQRRLQARASAAGIDAPAGRVRRISGSPIVWRELRQPLLSRRGIMPILGIVAAFILLLATYGAAAADNDLVHDGPHVAYALVFVGLGILCTSVLSATTISSEKESRSLPILLATPLDDWHIILGKAVGVLRRCLPVWLLLAGHVILFTFAGLIHPIALLHMGMLATWIILFFAGSGLYFSARFKKTTTAVVMNIGLAIALWAVGPIILSLSLLAAGRLGFEFLELYISANPMAQAIVLMDAEAGAANAAKNLVELRYNWPDDLAGGRVWAAGTTARMMLFLVLYGLAGLLFAARAKSRLRRNVF